LASAAAVSAAPGPPSIEVWAVLSESFVQSGATFVEIGRAESRPSAAEGDRWIALASFANGDTAWADSRACPALLAVVSSIERLELPKEPPERGADGQTFELTLTDRPGSGRAPTTRIFAQRGVEADQHRVIIRLVTTALRTLDACWRDVRPSRRISEPVTLPDPISGPPAPAR
jgi:hypothetical protein